MELDRLRQILIDNDIPFQGEADQLGDEKVPKTIIEESGTASQQTDRAAKWSR